MVLIEDSTALTVASPLSLSEDDLRLLATGYAPLMGTEALSLYLLLSSDSSFGSRGHSRFGKDLATATHLSLEAIMGAGRKLEGMGLLRTMSRETEKGAEVLFLVQPVMDAHSFLTSDYGQMLLKAVGQKRFEAIESLFPSATLVTEGFIDATESGAQVFGAEKLNSTKPTVIAPGLQVLQAAVSGELNKLGLSLKVLGDDLNSVLGDAVLYGATAELVARLVNECTGSNGVFHLENFRQALADRMTFARPLEENEKEDEAKTPALTDSATSNLIRVLEEMATADYLASYLHVEKAPESLMMLAGQLQRQYGFSSGVINTIFDYCFKKTKSVPSPAFIEKVALSILPRRPKNAYEASLCLTEARTEIKRKNQKRQKGLEQARRRAKEEIEGQVESQPAPCSKAEKGTETAVSLDEAADLLKGL